MNFGWKNPNKSNAFIHSFTFGRKTNNVLLRHSSELSFVFLRRNTGSRVSIPPQSPISQTSLSLSSVTTPQMTIYTAAQTRPFYQKYAYQIDHAIMFLTSKVAQLVGIEIQRYKTDARYHRNDSRTFQIRKHTGYDPRHLTLDRQTTIIRNKHKLRFLQLLWSNKRTVQSIDGFHIRTCQLKIENVDVLSYAVSTLTAW